MCWDSGAAFTPAGGQLGPIGQGVHQGRIMEKLTGWGDAWHALVVTWCRIVKELLAGIETKRSTELRGTSISATDQTGAVPPKTATPPPAAAAPAAQPAKVNHYLIPKYPTFITLLWIV